MEHPDTSAVGEHSINFGHHIQLHNTSILSTKPRYMDCNIREVTEIKFHPNNTVTFAESQGMLLGNGTTNVSRRKCKNGGIPGSGVFHVVRCQGRQ
jgi:hypothetical protein